VVIGRQAVPVLSPWGPAKRAQRRSSCFPSPLAPEAATLSIRERTRRGVLEHRNAALGLFSVGVGVDCVDDAEAKIGVLEPTKTPLMHRMQTS